MDKYKIIDGKRFGSDTVEDFVNHSAGRIFDLNFDGLNQYRTVAEKCFRHALEMRITVEAIRSVRANRACRPFMTGINEFLNSCCMGVLKEGMSYEN